MKQEIEYKGEKIVFDEYNEAWVWRRSEYEKPSKAKAAIDRMLRKDFERVEAYHDSYKGMRKVRVTSIADDGDVWVVDAEGNRSREIANYLFAANAENDTLLSLIAEKDKAIDVIRDEISNLHSQLVKFSLPVKGE